MKRGLLILSGFGYVMFLVAGIGTGLGVYRTPAYCFGALGCAVVAAMCAAKRPRVYWSIAGAAAIACSLYGYHENYTWRERLERAQLERGAPPASQAEAAK